MNQANLDFNYEICKQLHKEYRKLHNNPYAMLGDLHYFFYFSPCNFELYGLLLPICDKKYHGRMGKWLRTQNKQYFD